MLQVCVWMYPVSLFMDNSGRKSSSWYWTQINYCVPSQYCSKKSSVGQHRIILTPLPIVNLWILEDRDQILWVFSLPGPLCPSFSNISSFWLTTNAAESVSVCFHPSWVNMWEWDYWVIMGRARWGLRDTSQQWHRIYRTYLFKTELILWSLYFSVITAVP